MHLARRRLKQADLKAALRVATDARSRAVTRYLHETHGEWELERHRPRQAAEAFEEAIVLAQRAGLPVGSLRARFALATAQTGRTQAAAEILVECGEDAEDWCLAEAWLALGEREKARRHGLRGYKWAWADGPPHIHWWAVQRMKELLAELEVELPELPPFDLSAVEPLPYQQEIVAFIEEREAEQRKRAEETDS